MLGSHVPIASDPLAVALQVAAALALVIGSYLTLKLRCGLWPPRRRRP